MKRIEQEEKRAGVGAERAEEEEESEYEEERRRFVELLSDPMNETPPTVQEWEIRIDPAMRMDAIAFVKLHPAKSQRGEAAEASEVSVVRSGVVVELVVMLSKETPTSARKTSA